MTAPFEAEKFEVWVRTFSPFSQASLKSCQMLSQDGSGRIFWRVWLTGCPRQNFVYVEHPLKGGPVFEGDAAPQVQAFIELSSFLRRNKIAAPQFYASSVTTGQILMEDVGDISLASLTGDVSGEIREELEEQLKGDWIEKLFEQAIQIIAEVQAIPFDVRELAFRRFRSIDFLRAEIREFNDFYTEPLGLRPAARAELATVFDSICEELFSLPKTLSMFDFNAFNLFVELEPQAHLRVLDYQDACLSSPARDIFSLVNDRGMDEILGQVRQRRLIEHYVQLKQIKEDSRDDFFKQYYLTALHWDFRVVGRFNKLNKTLDTEKYKQWIPGTLRRLGRILVINQKILPRIGNVLDIVREISPEAKEGSEENWRLS